MTTVFVAGSIRLKRLPPRFAERLDSLVKSGLQIVIGDAAGADTAIQKKLQAGGAEHVTVYCSGHVPRNNVGGWNAHCVETFGARGTRAFHGAKDLEMAAVADFGLMLWDGESTGTLSNVIELTRRGKKTVVFVDPLDQFAVVADASTLQDLVEVMSDDARELAESKIGLSTRLRGLTSDQLRLSLDE